MSAWPAIVAALLVSALAVRHLAAGRTLVVMDHPNERSLHTSPVPRTGGIGIVLGIVLGEALAWWLAGGLVAGRAIAGCVLLVFAVSLLDDIRGLAPLPRLLVQLLAAALLTAWGVAPAALALPGATVTLPPVVSVLFGVLLLVWMTNLYNFMDGMDGLAGGMGAIGFATLAVLALLGGDARLALTGAIVSAACGGFLLFNFPPARIFMGDAGSSVLGFLAAGLGLAADRGGSIPLWATLLVFSPFIVDATLTLLRRAAAREPVWKAHRSHLYQRLARLGWGHRRTTLTAYVLMAGCAASAVALQFTSAPVQAGGLCGWAVIYAILVLCVNRLERRRNGHGPDAAG